MEDQPLTEERWLALYGSYPSLVRLARSLGAREDAEDVASAVLLRMASKGLDAELGSQGRFVPPEWSDLRRVVQHVQRRQ